MEGDTETGGEIAGVVFLVDCRGKFGELAGVGIPWLGQRGQK